MTSESAKETEMTENAHKPPKTLTSEERESMWQKMGPFEGIYLPPPPPGNPSWEEQIRDLRQMKLRDDDVLLLTYPKAGTHWLWEVMTMLRKGRAEHDAKTKVQLMMEFVTTEKLDDMPSPRTLNTHLPFSMLPLGEIKSRRVKLVHVYRNPKDTCVSMFYMLKSMRPQMPVPVDTFQDFYEFFFFGSRQVYGWYFDYLRRMLKFQQENPEVPSVNLSYEDVKKDSVSCVKKLARFMDLDLSDELYSDIAEACSFENMKKQADQKATTEFSKKHSPEELKAKMMMSKPVIYRKGQVGDWKNYFTVAMSERVDELVDREMKDLPFTLTFV